MNENKNPRLCEILGVEVNERFKITGYGNFLFYIDDEGFLRDMFSKNSRDYVEGPEIYELINYPHRLQKLSKKALTESEIAICKAIGAKWVSMDDEDEGVQLWASRPMKDEDGRFSNDEAYIGGLVCELFPFVKPGDCIEVEESGD